MIKGTILMLFCSLSIATAQPAKRLLPGKLYEPGEVLYAPTYGFTTTVPDGWNGVLPRDTEVFMLMSQTGLNGEVYVFADPQGSLNGYKERWQSGVSLSEGLSLQASETSVKDGILMGDVHLAGDHVRDGFKGFAAAKCGSHGPCVVVLVTAEADGFEQIKADALTVLEKGKFSEPTNVSMYVDFNWNEFLQGKMLINYMAVSGGSRESDVILCPDGTFLANIRKKGFMKSVNPKYKGKLRGTWTAEGIGETGRLRLEFTKLPSLEGTLIINDDKIFVEGERYFAAEAEGCE